MGVGNSRVKIFKETLATVTLNPDETETYAGFITHLKKLLKDDHPHSQDYKKLKCYFLMLSDYLSN